MKVYYVHCLQDSGIEAVCSTLEKAKERAKEMIAHLQPEHANDPDQWEGWTWWMHKGAHAFGDVEEANSEFRGFGEAYILEFEIDGPWYH